MHVLWNVKVRAVLKVETFFCVDHHLCIILKWRWKNVICNVNVFPLLRVITRVTAKCMRNWYLLSPLISWRPNGFNKEKSIFFCTSETEFFPPSREMKWNHVWLLMNRQPHKRHEVYIFIMNWSRGWHLVERAVTLQKRSRLFCVEVGMDLLPQSKINSFLGQLETKLSILGCYSSGENMKRIKTKTKS